MLRLLLVLCLVLGSMTSPLGDPDMENLVQARRTESRGLPSHKVGQLVSAWRPEHGTNPEELGSYQEGDMLLPPGLQNRNGVLNLSYRWPGAVVPYRIVGTFTAAERNMITSAINEYHSKTCLKFVPHTTQPDFISIESAPTGCWATLGRVGGMQRVNLQTPGCLYYVGTIIHELMHAVGFFHEHSRTDRDNWVNIYLQNVTPGQEHNFNKYDSNAFGVGYDYGSVMHYSKTSFSRNNLPTIEPKLSTASIGQRKAFSPSDVAKIKAMYGCP